LRQLQRQGDRPNLTILSSDTQIAAMRIVRLVGSNLKGPSMTRNTTMIALAIATSVATVSPALAKGCLKGAAVGGTGGHFVGKGHAVLGAAAGCAYGHHRAAKAARAEHTKGAHH
jgi:hypothetical protein